MDLGLNGRRCVVTGASSGIGRAVAAALTAEGARLLLVARGEAALRDAAPEGAEVLAADVTDPAAAERIVATAQERLGGLDVLVNNAGSSANIPLGQLSEADWELQWQLNVRGPERLMAAAAPLMAEAGWGRIVNVASSSGKRSSATNVAYSVTKSAQLALSRAYAEAWAARGVLVNAVTPGPTASELWIAPGGLADQAAAARGITRAQALEAAAARTPRGQLADPPEIADVVVFLCSERAANVVGAAWSADGGAVPSIL
ncbi:SDR family oxidoreductase [Conexibacter sp. JD483]|uniref:SDR family NAD(P)-dependent oxidoreductase n=1 Tax=unclassified Conexibacter TaxID=2627773 RepID=UPI0027224A1C|nr:MULTISPECIES: SDR family oxidoreductase [unclassified Conexibacter]MDO8184787.1 SDR family oxidoreductase [Conexibacter sp. CPCC 205706]MDO8196562.1 SDR family oxidoreductase [Conexibacter sp. CPCC 205762]MDR9368725.1 SDR family oxidoreductase [Conexibacter sp. JD483]